MAKEKTQYRMLDMGNFLNADFLKVCTIDLTNKKQVLVIEKFLCHSIDVLSRLKAEWSPHADKALNSEYCLFFFGLQWSLMRK